MVTFFALILMFAASPILVPVDVKQHPLVYRGSSKPAAQPVMIFGPDLAEPDSSRADSTAVEERNDCGSKE